MPHLYGKPIPICKSVKSKCATYLLDALPILRNEKKINWRTELNDNSTQYSIVYALNK